MKISFRLNSVLTKCYCNLPLYDGIVSIVLFNCVSFLKFVFEGHLSQSLSIRFYNLNDFPSISKHFMCNIVVFTVVTF